jgi:hypothetical protein
MVRYSVIDRVGHPGVDGLDGGGDGGELGGELLYDGLDELVDDSVHGVDGEVAEEELVTCG